MSIRLHSKYETQGIDWILGPKCASRVNLAVAANTFHERDCALTLDQTYILKCRSSKGDGYNSNFLIIENRAYCENFTTGFTEEANVTIRGNQILFNVNIIICTIKLN